MFSKLVFLLSIAFTIFSVVQAVPSRVARSGDLETNGSRFRRGLPPLSPVRKRSPRPSRVDSAKRYSPSSAPGTTYNGYICAYTNVNGSGNDVGCIHRDLTNGLYTLTNSNGNRLPVEFSAATSSTSTQVDIKDKYNNRPASQYMGGSGSTINAGSKNFVGLAGVAQTPGGAAPQNGATTYGGTGTVESAIWTFNPTTKRLTPTWVNPSGTTPITYIVQDENLSGKAMVLTGDVTQYTNNAGNKPVTPLYFFWKAT